MEKYLLVSNNIFHVLRNTSLGHFLSWKCNFVWEGSLSKLTYIKKLHYSFVVFM